MIMRTVSLTVVRGDDLSVMENVVVNPNYNKIFDDAFFEALPAFKDKVFFMINSSHSIDFHPEITRPNDIDYANGFLELEKALIKSKILSVKAVEKLKVEPQAKPPPNIKSYDFFCFLCILFDNKEEALKALETFDDGTQGYGLKLYSDGKLLAQSEMINLSVAIVSGDSVTISSITTGKGKGAFDLLPQLKTGAFFHKSIKTRPELIWPNTPTIWTHCNELNKTLISLNILSQKALDTLLCSGENSYALWVQYDSEEKAIAAYEAVISHNNKDRASSIVDIYIYNDGDIIRKFD